MTAGIRQNGATAWRRLRAADAPSDDNLPLWKIYRPFFDGRGAQIALLAVFSFAAGICEAALLVILANIAVNIGADQGADAIEGALGPLGGFTTNTGTAFFVALLLGIARFISQMVAAHLAAKMTAELTTAIRTDTYRDFAATSWAEQSRHGEAEIQDLLLRHVNRATSSLSTISSALSTACTLAALVASAVLVDPRSALLLAVSGALLFVLIRPLSMLAKQVSKRQQEAGLAYGARSLEAIGRSLEIRAFGVTKPVVEQLTTATVRESRTVYQGFIIRQTVVSVYQTVTILLLLGGLFAVWTFLDRPLASLGAIVIILIRALNQTSSLQSAYHSLTETTPFLQRLEDERASFRARRPQSGDIELTSFDRLRFDGVTYAYEPGRAALSDVTFEVRAGEAVGIIGPSGSGKSTLIQLILRLREPTDGQYLIDDTDAGQLDDDAWYERIAFVPQDSNLISDTVRANIAFYRDTTDEEIEAAARRAHIHDEILAMPDGYDTHLGNRGGTVSGGQRQRISIARALLKRPSILILDEPTSALDMRSERLVHDTFTDLKGSVTLFAIAHRLSTLNTCDRIMVMGNGHLQAFGSRAELEAGNAFYREAVALSQIRT